MEKYTIEMADPHGNTITAEGFGKNQVVDYVLNLVIENVHKNVSIVVKNSDGFDVAYKPFGEGVLMWLEKPEKIKF